MNDLHRYIIIGGTTKAGTTSLFFYLRDHPDICASNNKETRFFLDPDYPLQGRYNLERDGMEKYWTYFNHCPQTPLRLEATPDYLYSPGTALRIRNGLPDVKMIFILRDPVERLISWYRFARQRGLLDLRVGFDDYVRIQQELADQSLSSPHQHLRALQEGRYSHFLQPYEEVFGVDNLMALDFNDLSSKPNEVIVRVCDFIQVNCRFYEDYQFAIINKTRNMRNAGLHKIYSRFKAKTREKVRMMPKVHRFLKQLKNVIEPIYMKFNANDDEKIRVSPQTRIFLKKYYNN